METVTLWVLGFATLASGIYLAWACWRFSR